MNRSIGESRKSAIDAFRNAGFEEPALEANVILQTALGIDRTRLLMQQTDTITPDQRTHVESMIARRLAGEPSAYITGHREFMGLDFMVTPDVLIPRPETELLVEWALDWLKDHPRATIVDVGTGSGAIAISVVAHAPHDWTGTMIAIDISSAALAIAGKNADQLLPSRRRDHITFRHGPLLEPLQQPVDLVLANLPYLTNEQIAENPDIEPEPTLALDGGHLGLDLILGAIGDLPRTLLPGGAGAFEIDPSQTETVIDALTRALPHARCRVIQDLSGRDRHIVFETDG